MPGQFWVSGKPPTETPVVAVQRGGTLFSQPGCAGFTCVLLLVFAISTIVNPEDYLQIARVALHPAEWNFMDLRYVLCMGFLALVVMLHAVVQKLTHLRVQPPNLTLKGPFYARYIPLEQIEWVYVTEDITRFTTLLFSDGRQALALFTSISLWLNIS